MSEQRAHGRLPVFAWALLLLMLTFALLEASGNTKSVDQQTKKLDSILMILRKPAAVPEGGNDRE